MATRCIVKTLCLLLCFSACLAQGSKSSQQPEPFSDDDEPTFAEKNGLPVEKILEYSSELQTLRQHQLAEEIKQKPEDEEEPEIDRQLDIEEEPVIENVIGQEPSFAEINGLPKDKILEFASELQQLHQLKAYPQQPTLDAAFFRSVCPVGLVHVTAGMRLYSNSRNYNQNGRKCDWSLNPACDVKFYVTYSWTGQSGLKEFDDQEYGIFKNSATINFNPQYLYQQQACAVAATYFKIGVRAVDVDKKGQEEPIGEWNFQYYVYPGDDDEDIKISQKSGAYVKVFFDS